MADLNSITNNIHWSWSLGWTQSWKHKEKYFMVSPRDGKALATLMSHYGRDVALLLACARSTLRMLETNSVAPAGGVRSEAAWAMTMDSRLAPLLGELPGLQSFLPRLVREIAPTSITTEAELGNAGHLQKICQGRHHLEVLREHGVGKQFVWGAIQQNQKDVLARLVQVDPLWVSRDYFETVGSSRGNGVVHPLNYAASQGKDVIVAMILKIGGKRVIDTMDSCGLNPLKSASVSGHLNIVRILLDGGAEVAKPIAPSGNNVNNNVKRDQSALMMAVCHGHETVARVLVEAGATVSARDVVSSASGAPHTGSHLLLPWLCSLLPKGDVVLSAEVLHSVVEIGAVEAVVVLLERGANPKIRRDNATPLHTVASASSLGLKAEASIEVCELLMRAGAEIDAADHSDATPLYRAVERGWNIALVKHLLHEGASPHAAKDCGTTPKTRASGRMGLIFW